MEVINIAQTGGPTVVHSKMATWWAIFTQEEYNSMIPEGGSRLPSIPGETRMPRFEKVVGQHQSNCQHIDSTLAWLEDQ